MTTAVLTSRAFVLFVLVFLGGCSSSGQWVLSEGQQPEQFESEITKIVGARFLLYLPEGFRTEHKRWPLMMFLHGSGERGSNLEKVKVNGPPKFLEQRKDFQFVVASPQLPDDAPWSSDVLNALLDELIERLPIDTDRVYLTGLSLGGFATWDFACDFPARFAAIAPICGRGDEDRACLLKNVPVWAFHGAKDPVVPLKDEEEMVNALKACGGDVKLTIYPDAGHDAWTETYANPELYNWFLTHRRHHGP
jgi:predicted peptidase